MPTQHGNADAYEKWGDDVASYLASLQVRIPEYVALTNLRGLYNVGLSVEQGAYAVLDVAARHGNVDAKNLLRRREVLGL